MVQLQSSACMANDSKSHKTGQRLERCWNEDLNWIRIETCTCTCIYFQGLGLLMCNRSLISIDWWCKSFNGNNLFVLKLVSYATASLELSKAYLLPFLQKLTNTLPKVLVRCNYYYWRPFYLLGYITLHHYDLVNHLKELWMPGKTKNLNPRVSTIKSNSKAFRRHDQVQEQHCNTRETLASMDNLLSGQCKINDVAHKVIWNLLFSLSKSNRASTKGNCSSSFSL